MKISPLSIEGAWEIVPVVHGDRRGRFVEWFRQDLFTEAVGHPMLLAQGNLSVSAKDVVRGVHFADVPPSQAKYVSCVRGAVLDVIVDLRVGSESFGAWEFVRLDDEEHRSVYVSEGLGHGFVSLTDDAMLHYCVSAGYNPEREHTVHPLDPDLGIDWPVAAPILSARDEAAPTLAQALESDLLPRYEECIAYTSSLSG